MIEFTQKELEQISKSTGVSVEHLKKNIQETTKLCYKCGNADLSRQPSLNYKYCTDCNTVIPWKLSQDQESLL